MTSKIKGFTLIELLIVVAIIGILAAIAIPNFLQAQVRAKVSRAQADMASMHTAIASFEIDQPNGSRLFPVPDKSTLPMDQNQFLGFCGPNFNNPCGAPGGNFIPCVPMFELTTPIAYISDIPANPFPDVAFTFNCPDIPVAFRYFAETWKDFLISNNPSLPNTPFQFAMSSHGSDANNSLGEYMLFGQEILNQQAAFGPFSTPGSLYDPTNGTISNGDIVRVGP